MFGSLNFTAYSSLLNSPPIGTPAFQGEHNVAVFSELGVDEAHLKRLKETGALVTHRRVQEPETAVKAGSEPGKAA